MSSEVKPSRFYPHRFPRSGFAWWRDSQSSFLFIQSPACEWVGRSCWPRVWYGSAPSLGPPDRVLVPGVTFLFRRDVRTARIALLKAAAGPALRRGPSAASRSSGPLWPPARVRIGGDESMGSRGRGTFSSAHCGLQSFVSCPTALFLLVSLPRPLSFPLAQGKRASTSKKAVSCSGSGMAVFFSSYTELLPF